MNVQLTDFCINAFNKFTHHLKCVQRAFHTMKTYQGVCRFPACPIPYLTYIAFIMVYLTHNILI